jgi:hypothetical protein
VPRGMIPIAGRPLGNDIPSITDKIHPTVPSPPQAKKVTTKFCSLDISFTGHFIHLIALHMSLYYKALLRSYLQQNCYYDEQHCGVLSWTCRLGGLLKYSYPNLANLTGHPVTSTNRGLCSLPPFPSPENFVFGTFCSD